MASLKGFWQFLNTDIKDIPWGELSEQGIELVSASSNLGEKWEEHKSDLHQLAPYFAKIEPFFTFLNDPDAQVAISGLPFLSIGIGLLRLYLSISKTEPTIENSAMIVAQLAYLQSLEVVLAQVQDITNSEKLATLSLKSLIEKQIAQLDTETLNSNEIKIVTSRFRESKLAKQFSKELAKHLQQAGLDEVEVTRLIDQVTWGTHRYIHQAIAEVGDSVKPLADLYAIGGQHEQDRYTSIDAYLENVIAPLSREQVFDENEPLITFNDIYVSLKVQPLTQSGENQEGVKPINIHDWARDVLDQTGPRKVMFVEGGAGQGKSVFCWMFADWVCQNLPFAYIPLFIRLRSLRAVANSLTETLETCPDLESAEFVGKEGWLKDKNTRFLIILDGFDELLLEGRSTGGLQEFLQQVSDFQERSHHQCLVTGRPLALQGVAQRITQNKNLERVKLQPMDDALREQWLIKWQTIFGEEEVTQFQTFLKACPAEISNNLAREPLLIYLLARLHREKQLTSGMFADTQKEIQAKLRVYREAVNWVLNKQRQTENIRLSGLEDPDDLREVLQEAALCVVQSGNETAQLSMLKSRFQDSANPVSTSLKTSQETTGQSEDKALNNLLTTFYLRPGKGDKRGSVEFAHKSFSEYLFAERLIAAFQDWTELDRKKRNRFNDQVVYGQIYDLLGFGGLSIEIIEYLFSLLDETELDQVRLFQRLHGFYQRWSKGDFLDEDPTENLPQKKRLQFRNQENILIGLKQVDVFTGLNILILLFKLHAIAQPASYPNTRFRPDIFFHPCREEPIDAEEDFDDSKLLRIIHYADSLGANTFNQRVGFYGESLSIGTFTQIVGPHLAKANLSGANLYSINLSGANLSGADLSNANLDRINLDRANLSGANLSGTYLDSANLYNTNLYNANLSRAYLDSTNLDRANLSEANLSEAKLSNVYLDSANLSKANLSEANLYNANLYSANLSEVNLLSAYLDSTYLACVNLHNACLDRAILFRTHLLIANNLTSQQLEGAYPPFICGSKLPQSLEHYQDRDRGRLAAELKKRYPNAFDSLEAAEKYINENCPASA